MATADEAVAVIPDGATIMMGGFGLCGIPEHLIAALHRRGTRDLTIVSNNAGVDDFGIGQLLRARQVRKMIATYVGENKEFERQFLHEGARGGAGAAGHVLGTHPRRWRRHRRLLHADRVRHAVAEGKETRVIDGRTTCSRRRSAPTSPSSRLAGRHRGNLVYSKTARNFNPVMATAARDTIAEVEHLVRAGRLEPDSVHTPGIYVSASSQGAATRSGSRNGRQRNG